MMQIDPRLERMLAELGVKLGFDALKLDDDGACALQFDERVIVNFVYEPEQDRLVLISDVGAPRAGATFYPMLLQANLFDRSTDGITLALSHDEPGHVILYKSLEWRTQSDISFFATLESFVETVEHWTTLVETNDPVQPPTETQSLDPDQFNIRV